MKLILTEFQKLKRNSIIIVGLIAASCSPFVSVVTQNVMSDDAKTVLSYTFPDLINSTVWNNATVFFPMILALIGGYMVSREYTDDTLKNVLTVPVSFSRLMAGKLGALGIIALLLGLFSSLVTLLVGMIFCRENLTLSTVIPGSARMIAMTLFTCIGELPLIALCGRKQGAYRGGALVAFLLGYFSIFIHNPLFRSLYPLSAGFSLIQFSDEGFVAYTAGGYSTSQHMVISICVLLVMIAMTGIIVHIPIKDSIAAASLKTGRGSRRKSRER